MLTWFPAAPPEDCPLIDCAEGYWLENSGLVSYNGCPIYNCKGREKVPSVPCPEPTCPPGFSIAYLENDYEDDQQNYQGSQQSQKFEQQHSQNVQQPPPVLNELQKLTLDQQHSQPSFSQQVHAIYYRLN